MSTAVSERVTSYPPAGLDRRFYAYAVDRVAAWPLLGAGGYAAYVLFLDDGEVLPGVALVGVVLAVVAVAFAVVLGTLGSSPGKAALGLRLVSVDAGRPIGVGPALLRTVIVGAAALPTFGLGLASLAWTAAMDRGRQRRGWHDHVSGSIVVDVRPVAEPSLEVAEAPRQVVNLTAMRLAPAPPPTPAPMPPPTPPPGPARRTEPPTIPPPPAPATAVEPEADRTVVRGSAPRPAPTGVWRVTFDDGHTLVVDGLALVGRRPEGRPGEPVRHLVPLTSSDMSVSKTHAQLQVAPDGALVVMDRGSTNGSVLVRSGVARELPPGKPTTVLPGDEVRFGDRSMTAVRDA